MTKLLLAFSIAGLVYGQHAFTAHDGEEHPLISLESSAGRVFAGLTGAPNLVCGKYFVLVGNRTILASERAPAIIFLLGEGQRPADLLRQPQDTLVVVLDGKKQTPTARYIVAAPGEPVPYYWVIKISPKDYRTATPCLPNSGDQKVLP